MKDKILHYTKEIALFFIVLTLFANAISLYKSQELNSEPLSKIKATLTNGSHFSTADKKPLLMHFWATWCPTCKLEATNISYLANYYEVITIAVNSGSDAEINSYLKENNLDLKVINDKEGLLARKFNIAAYPTTFIYNKDRELTFSEVGYTSTLGLFLRVWWSSL